MIICLMTRSLKKTLFNDDKKQTNWVGEENSCRWEVQNSGQNKKVDTLTMRV